MNTEKILRLQRALKDCQTVYAVHIQCDGEDTIDALWETHAAAELHRDSHNKMKGNGTGYYGRARIVKMQIRTEAMARDWFDAPAEAIEICERDNTIATLRQEIRLMHEDARAKEARIAELERELMAISQDDGKVERALERANDRIAELEKVRLAASRYFDNYLLDEAEDRLVCHSAEQHEMAKDLRDALDNCPLMELES